MKSFFTILLYVLLLQTVAAQTKTDSISGKYTRHTWTGVGNVHLDYGNGTYAEVHGYTIATTDEVLQLDKNHCAALTVNTQPGNSGSMFFFMGNPIVYYGIWRMSGDTVVVTYTKSFSEPLYLFIEGAEPGITKMSEPMQRKYLLDENNSLESLTTGDNENYVFYKEEKTIQ